MDSCHLFNFLFGTRKTTTELRKCFAGQPATSRSRGQGRTRPAEQRQRSEQGRRVSPPPPPPPGSPLRQIHSKLVNFATSAGVVSVAAKSAVPPTAAASSSVTDLNEQLATTTIVKRNHPSGTYKATLVELPADCEVDGENGGGNSELIKQQVDDEQVDSNNNNNNNKSSSKPEASANQTNGTTISNRLGAKRRASCTLYDNPTASDELAEPMGEVKPEAQIEVSQQDKSLSERVRQLVQSFESFDSAAPSAGTHVEQSEQVPRSPGGRNSLRLRWPPGSSGVSEQQKEQRRRQSAEEAPTSGARKPTTIVKPLPPKTPPKSKRAKCLNLQLSLNKPLSIEQLFQDDLFLKRHFFAQLRPLDRCSAAQVCRKWRDILYSNSDYWKELVGVIDCTQLRREHLIECIVNTLQSAKQKHSHQHNHASSGQPPAQNGHVANGRATGTCELDEALECLDQEEIWRIQELCNRYTRGSLAIQHFPTRSLLGANSVGAHQNQQHYEQLVELQEGQPQAVVNGGQAAPNGCLASSKSQSSIPSQISSTLSSISISSLLSPLSESSRVDSIREKLYTALDERGFDSLCLFGATDDDIEELVSKTRPQGAQARVLAGRLSSCPVSDKGLELFVSTFNHIEELELTGCNELTNALELKPLSELKRLTITDCINIADGLAQRLLGHFQQLEALTIQAYHLTDAFLEFISLNADTSRLARLELPNCKELTNASMLTIAKHFPNLSELSISGSTKITDDGIEILTEHAKRLRSLDLSWCTRITDASLECLACDLTATLSELILDRNAHITDAGLGYLATMSRLELLYFRWCSRITDLGLESVLGMRTLRRLSLAGLHQVTARSLLCLVEAPSQQLEEVELTNCPAVNSDLMQFLRTKMPKCNIIF